MVLAFALGHYRYVALYVNSELLFHRSSKALHRGAITSHQTGKSYPNLEEKSEALIQSLSLPQAPSTPPPLKSQSLAAPPPLPPFPSLLPPTSPDSSQSESDSNSQRQDRKAEESEDLPALLISGGHKRFVYRDSNTDYAGLDVYVRASYPTTQYPA